MADVDFLRRIPLFKDLLRKDLETVEGLLEDILLPADQDLFKQGDPAQSLYIVASGCVRIIKSWPDRGSGIQEVEVTTLGPGEILGEMALVRDCQRSCTARTAETTSLLVLRKDKLHVMLTKDLRIWAQIAYNIAAILSNRVERMDELLSRNAGPVAPSAEPHPPESSPSLLSRLFKLG